VLTIKGLVCSQCGTKQYFGIDQPYGMLNRHHSIRQALQLAIRHLWFAPNNLGEGICPTCVVIHKPRMFPKVKVLKDAEVTRDPYGYGYYQPFLLLLWRKTVILHNITIYENSLRFNTGRYTYLLNRGDLIDPLMFDLFTTKHKKPDYKTWFEMVIKDQMEYVQHMQAAPVERGEVMHVIREHIEEGAE